MGRGPRGGAAPSGRARRDTSRPGSARRGCRRRRRGATCCPATCRWPRGPRQPCGARQSTCRCARTSVLYGVVVDDAVIVRVAVVLGGLVGALGRAASAREHHDAARLARGASVRRPARAAIERSRRSTAPPHDATDRCAGVLLQRRVARRRRAPPLEGQPLELAARRRRHAARRETRCASSTTPSKGAATLHNTAQTREPTWRSHAHLTSRCGRAWRPSEPHRL